MDNLGASIGRTARAITCSGPLALAAFALGWVAPAEASEPEVGVPAELPGAGPFFMRTAEQPHIKVEIIASGLAHVYSLAFLPGGDALIVERGARLRLLRQAAGAKPQLMPEPIANVPDYSKAAHVDPDDVLGIQDVMPDPDFAANHVIYFTYNRPVGYDAVAKRITAATVVARATLDGMRLTGTKDLLVGEVRLQVRASRLMIKGGWLFVAVCGLNEGDAEAAQQLDNIYGKVLRIGLDGNVPPDNPFVHIKGARPEIWTYGHRDVQGLAIEPRSGRLIASEHGPQGGDEVNDLLPGQNYGWPKSTYGTDYDGSRLPSEPVAPGTEAPIMIWSPGVAPSGSTFYTGNAMSGWRNNLFVASARRGEINGTGGLVRVVFNDRLEEVREEFLLSELHQRFKDVRQGPDGLLYAVTDEDQAAVLRIGPAADPGDDVRTRTSD
jgi:glucose/arabinose dehydrogenase